MIIAFIEKVSFVLEMRKKRRDDKTNLKTNHNVMLKRYNIEINKTRDII